MKKHKPYDTLSWMIYTNAALLSDEGIDLSQAGIDTIPLAQAEVYLQGANPSVLGAHCSKANYDHLFRLMDQEKQKNPHKRFILFFEDLEPSQLIKMHNLLNPVKTLAYSKDLGFPLLFQECLASYDALEQDKQLMAMVKESNDELKRLTLDLEEKVVQRQSQLEDSLLKNREAEKKLQVLKMTLMKIYQAPSIREIEQGVASALKELLGISGVQIRRVGQTNFAHTKVGEKSYKTSLKIGSQESGHIYFFRQKGPAFSGSQKRFLNQVAEAASLSMARTIQAMNSQELKTQWEATFDAILDPICLTDENYRIKRVNAGFLKKTGTNSYQEHQGKKCYEALFQREKPCQGCMRGQVFQIFNSSTSSQSEVFDVYSNKLEESGTKTYFQMYREITADLNLQSQLIESAKMAELGIISSSIAHELNNPIAGMLNFVQLIKIDHEEGTDLYQDILEIEEGIIKCKNIVKNLLDFSRKSFDGEIATVNLQEVIEQAIKITEVKTRSIGIGIEFQPSPSEVWMEGRFNRLTHALRNILQNSQETLIAKRKKDKFFTGQIQISLKETPHAIEIQVRDNGEGIKAELLSKIFDPLFTTKDPETNPGLGLTLALQIVQEHQGTIEVSVDKDKKLLVKVRFFKAEVQSGS